jgi:TonB-linked SusC/RagA family outer membrane protein
MMKIKLLLLLSAFFVSLGALKAKLPMPTDKAAFPISGKITTADGEALVGASVVVKGTTIGTVTDIDGKFKLDAPDGNGTLVISYVGYETQEVPINNRTVIDFVLKEGSALQEVVVVGYGTQKKSQTTGAISSITKKQITELPVMNARQALQGRAAGVDVTQAGSKPGSAPQIRIRGRRSFNASNDPLYVVDGIPIAGGIDDINPQDITSMEVLKDASSTAIYGARGANGVVLITTNRGSAGKTTVTFNTWAGPNQSLGRIEVMNGAQFAEYRREALRATGNYPAGTGAASDADEAKAFEPVVLANIKAGKDFDYVAALLREGFVQSHQIDVTGGNEKTQFFISGNFFKDKGVIKNQDFSRGTFRINLDHKINNRIKVGTSTLAVHSVRNGENFNPIGGAMQENPLGKTFNDDGTPNFLPTSDGLRTNPLFEIVPGAIIDETKRYRIFNSLYGEWNILDGLTYRVNFGPDFNIRRTGNFVASQTNARRGGAPTGSKYNEIGFNYTIENILNYNKTLGEKHTIGATALQSIQKDNFDNSNISVLGIPAETQQFNSLGSASQVTGVSTNLVQWTLLSYMGRINYSYDDRYLITATMRADGSSRFGENTKFGYFPSVAVGWNIANESFLKGTKWLDQLKLRLSYGSIGNQAINPYQTQALLGRTSYAWGTSAAFGYRPATIGNADLKWESSTTANAGLDFSFFSGRVSGSLEYYITDTKDLLAPQPLPTSIGFGGFTTNIGHTRNKGVELTMSTVNVDKRDFQWTTDWTFMKNTESIIELANGKVDDIAAGRFIGKPLTVFYDLKKIGVWQTADKDLAASYVYNVGEIRIEDANNDGKIDASDRQILGSAVPKWAGGLTNRFNYKGFDFNFFIFARIGQMIASRFHDQQNLLFGRYNNINVDYWTPNNPTNDFPRPNQNQERPRNSTSMIYFDGSFIKLRNVNFGYQLPSDFAKKMRAESIRAFVSIQQPLIISEYRSRYKGIDPETQIDGEQGVGGGEVTANISPAVKIITFGINAKF